MYPVSQNFLDSLKSGNMQHIRGEIVTLTGSSIPLNGSNLAGSPKYEKQCVENPDVFMFGQVYTGSVEFEAEISEIRRTDLYGAEVSFDFGVDTGASEPEWIPLGVWYINDPQRISKNKLKIKGFDCIGKLDVAIDNSSTGYVDIERRMKMVTRLTGVEFAQTLEEIAEMLGIAEKYLYRFVGTHHEKTCRAEVVAIAQIIGGFAFANREGKIEFRRFGNVVSSSKIILNQNMRFSAKLSEYTCNVGEVVYIDEHGKSQSVELIRYMQPSESITLSFSSNPLIGSDFSVMKKSLEYVPNWIPGEVDYYGCPALDVGDLVWIQDMDGSSEDENLRFLITSDYWQFRSPQKLISAGTGTVNLTGSSSGGAYAPASSSSLNFASYISFIDMKSGRKQASSVMDEIGIVDFNAKINTIVFAQITAVLQAENDGISKIDILLDGICQTVHAVDFVKGNQPKTVHFSVPLNVSSGAHRISAECSADCEISEFYGCVWGQEISETKPETTYSDDYKYHIENDYSVIDKYFGDSLKPSVPAVLGGKNVKIIGEKSFMESGIVYAEIPDGTEEIK